MNSAIYDAIRSQAQSFVTASGVMIFWLNERVNPPTDSSGNPVTYVWAAITGVNGEQRSMGAPGANAFRDDGFIRFHFMTPYGAGMDHTFDLVSQLAAVFRLASFSGVQCLAPTPPEGTDTDDGNWYITSFSVPFFYYFFG